jgi:flagellar basal body rod protein FlgC
LVPDFQIAQDEGDVPQVKVSGSHVQRGSSVDTIAEMVCVLNASRAYEANASIFDIGKRLAERTIDMGKV